MAYILGSGGQVPERKAAGPAKKARTVSVELPADIALKVSVADLARIGAAAGAPQVSKARTAQPAKRKGRRPVARKKSGKRWACWKCGGRMRTKALYCKKCTRPAAAKSAGGKAGLVPMPVTRPPKPRCPNPACGAKGGRTANACSRCGTPFSQMHAARAEKSARRVQLSIAGSPAYWEARAMSQHDPAEREACFAEARKALQARGAESSSLVSLMVKASGASSVREAWLHEADPRAREVLWQALSNGGGRSA